MWRQVLVLFGAKPSPKRTKEKKAFIPNQRISEIGLNLAKDES
jgi:hypothetical protein